MEEQARRNIAMFEQAMRMFSPFAKEAAQATPSETERKPGEDDLEVLKKQLSQVQDQLDRLSKKR